MGKMKQGWKWVKLGDVAINSTEATKDYEADGYTKYIIGKHIPDGGRITTWNQVGDGEFGSRIRTIVRVGDVICTTRGPKLRVAVADFDCLSAHTNFILSPIDSNTLLPGFLEAIVRSDGFQDHLQRHFRGSTNLFVNWSDAASYEFALPSHEEQRSICRLLSNSSSLVEAERLAVVSSEVLEIAFLDSIVSKWFDHFEHTKLGQLLSVPPQSGCSAPPSSDQTGHSVLALSALERCGYRCGELKPVHPSPKMMAAQIRNGDLLISRSNTRERVGFVGIVNEDFTEPVSFPDTMMRLVPKRDFIKVASLELLLQATPIRRRIMAIAAGTSASMKKINKRTLSSLVVPAPSRSAQELAIEVRSEIRAGRQACESRFAQAKETYWKLLRTLVEIGI